MIYKGLYTFLCILLFQKLSAQHFATWANLNSMIYIILLWLDGGFHKSIARFIPEFSKNTKALNSFVFWLIIVKITMLTLALPLFLIIAPYLCRLLNLYAEPSYFLLASITLCMQGILFTCKLIYHAHFWNKEFNLINTAFLVVETMINIILLYMIHEPTRLIESIFCTKIISSMLTTMITLILLSYRYHHRTATYLPLNSAYLVKAFIQHSLFIWFSTIIKSVTERNIMLPLLTYCMGHTTANIFKIANDGALFLYRFVTNTIGSADTAFLTHAALISDHQSLPTAFKELVAKVLNLCLLAIIMLVPLTLLFNTKLINHSILYIFLLLTSGYLLESLLSPYERLLEIKRCYWFLLVAYAPYMIMLIFLMTGTLGLHAGLLSILAIIHGSRLVSSLIMVRLAHT